MDEKTFYEGQVFSCKEELLSFFREFCKIHSQRLTIRDSSDEKLVLKCCHGRKRKSTSTGQRPNQHYLFKNCMAQVNVRKNKQNYWQVTKVDLEHNHEIGGVQCDMNDRKRKRQRKGCDLEGAETKDSIIEDGWKKKSDKFLTPKEIQNVKNRLFPTSTEEKETELKNFLLNLAEENGRCMIHHGNGGTVEALFMATGVMIDCLRKSQPKVILVDISLDVKNYKLLCFSYFSCVTGNSEFAALAFILKESLEIVKECMEKLKLVCVSDPVAFLINKNFLAISAIKDVFPLSKILLCKFSVLICIKKLLFSAVPCHRVTKQNVFKVFKKVLNSQTEEEYQEQKLDLLTIANELEVRCDDKYMPFRDLFNEDWDSCKEMWVDCYRKTLPLLKDSTTDRIERSFSILKNHIQTKFFRTQNICECIFGVLDFVNKQLSNCFSKTAQEVFKIINKNPKIRILLESASLKLNETGLKLLHESIVSLEALKSTRLYKSGNRKGILETCSLYHANIKSCSCKFWKLNEAPCQHIVFLREFLRSESGLEDCFHERYLVKEDSEDDFEVMEKVSEEDSYRENVNICEDVGNDDEMETLSYIERYKIASAATSKLYDVVSAHDTEKCLEYVEVIKYLGELIRQGKSVVVIPQYSQKSKSTKES